MVLLWFNSIVFIEDSYYNHYSTNNTTPHQFKLIAKRSLSDLQVPHHEAPFSLLTSPSHRRLLPAQAACPAPELGTAPAHEQVSGNENAEYCTRRRRSSE